MLGHVEPVVRWKVRYEAGADPIEVLLPHAWRQDMPADYEGPVVYETTIQVPRCPATLLFNGVSYAADVSIDGHCVTQHRGIWDAFDIPLDRWRGKTVVVRVAVVKNGGPSYPVGEVASGFLPFVFNGFGGIYGSVELVPWRVQMEPPAPPTRVRVEGRRIFVDERPFYARGLLHWGWYPEIGHPSPPESTIREEVQAARARGFNLVKFCMWAPPHRYLEILREEGMEAWMELPLWRPANDPAAREQIAAEIGRLVRQYRRHDNIVAWTIGCELGDSVPYAFRAELTQTVRNLTGCPLVRDVSGGAEQYGGDLREEGTFFDFHPYGDLQFLPAVLDSLVPGPRGDTPTLLGETMDADVHRDVARIGDEMPYWASALSELNPRGLRWQYDLPAVVAESRFATHPTRSQHSRLLESSRKMSLFVRKTATEAIRARESIAGYVMTGWRDTPISSSGLFDDWNEPRYTPDECAAWNAEAILFLIPARRPAWVAGGNRPGYLDSFNHFAGSVYWRVGFASEAPTSSGLVWKLTTATGERVASGAGATVTIEGLTARAVGEIRVELTPGDYCLEVEFGGARNAWPIWVVPPPDPVPAMLFDAEALFAGLPVNAGGATISTGADPREGISFLTGEGTMPAPFWRMAAYEFIDSQFWDIVPYAERWSRLLPVAGDRVLDPGFLRERVGEFEVLMNRVDTRTYHDSPVLVRHAKGLITCLRPFGGLGVQPTSIAVNPAGYELLRALSASLCGQLAANRSRA